MRENAENHAGSGRKKDARLAHGLILTPRDLTLLTDLWGFGALLQRQIHALYFSETAARRVNRRLKLLADAGLILAEPLTLGPLSFPSLDSRNATGQVGESVPFGGPRVFRLGSAAAGVVAERMGGDADAVRRRQQEIARSGRAHLAHSLTVAEVRLALEATLRRRPESGITLLSFQGEAPLRHLYEVRDGNESSPAAWRREVFKPDGLARVLRDDRVWHLFLEVDLSSVGATEIRHKLRIAARYRREPSLFRRRYAGADPDRFHTLLLTTSDRRAENLAGIAREEGAGFMRAATLSDFAAQGEPDHRGAFAPIWRSPGRDGFIRLFDEGDEKENR